MGDTVNVSWAPPPSSWLVYEDCNAAATWLASYSAMYENGDLSWEGVSLEVAIAYLRSLVPSNWTQPTDSDLLVWYQQRTGGLQNDNTTFNDMLNFPLARCGTELCHKLQWQGDPDLAGVGAMISYCILAFFTTVYFLVLAADALWRLSEEREKRNKKLVFFISGFKKSLNTFQDAVLLFAISINVAAMTRWFAPIIHPNDSHAFYGLLNSVFMSSFAIFPALALQSLTPGLNRRRGVRLSLWSLLIVFAIIVEVLYRYVYMTDFFLTLWNQKVQYNEDIWLRNCDSAALRVRLGYLTMAGHIFLTINCLWWLYHVTSPVRRSDHRRIQKLKGRVVKDMTTRAVWRGRWETWQLYLRLSNGFLCSVFMWLFLALYTFYREDVRLRAGESDQDGEWTFGQVLSMVTWAPMGVELVTVYLYESSEGSVPQSEAQSPENAQPYERNMYNKRTFKEALETISLNDNVGHLHHTDSMSTLGSRPWTPVPTSPARTRHFV